MPSTILIAGGGTGGHLMPALAIASTLRETRPDIEPVLVGATRGIEAGILPSRPFRYELLPAEPVYRRQWWKNARWPFIAVSLVRQINRLLQREKPALVVGTGGYASGPVVWLAARRGIPTAIQEQNAFPGIATRRLARRVRHVYLGLPEARSVLKTGSTTEVFDTGNPIVPPDRSRRMAAREKWGIAEDQRVLLITGGSQGALAINRTVAQWIDAGGGRTITILWATGRASYPEFNKYHRPSELQVFDFIDPMSDALAAADLVVARAGAMTIAELCAWGLPSILIPLPTAAADHQTHNAGALAAAGASRLLPQSELSVESLGTMIQTLLARDEIRGSMSQAALRRGQPDASAAIVKHILSLLPPEGQSGPPSKPVQSV
jgi:UDP-N-acetylglucosamine--N-acetylmuramyl-(pentapeptide) pyrophosphoryl-undecaprenol N-acetylglucosamine transferase